MYCTNPVADELICWDELQQLPIPFISTKHSRSPTSLLRVHTHTIRDLYSAAMKPKCTGNRSVIAQRFNNLTRQGPRVQCNILIPLLFLVRSPLLHPRAPSLATALSPPRATVPAPLLSVGNVRQYSAPTHLARARACCQTPQS